VTPLALGDIPAGEHRAVWLRWIVNSSAAAINPDATTVRMEGTTAA
jgi:hypothetical protein